MSLTLLIAQAPGRNDVVTEQFSYSVIDSAGAQSTATLTIAVQGDSSKAYGRSDVIDKCDSESWLPMAA